MGAFILWAWLNLPEIGEQPEVPAPVRVVLSGRVDGVALSGGVA